MSLDPGGKCPHCPAADLGHVSHDTFKAILKLAPEHAIKIAHLVQPACGVCNGKGHVRVCQSCNGRGGLVRTAIDNGHEVEFTDGSCSTCKGCGQEGIDGVE